MSMRKLLLQVRRRCLHQQQQQVYGLLFRGRKLSILLSEVETVMARRSPPFPVHLLQRSLCSGSEPLGSGFRMEAVDSDLWPVSFSSSLEPAGAKHCPDAFEQCSDTELHDTDDEIDDMRYRKKLFYKLDRGSREFEENNVPLRRSRKRDKSGAKNPKDCDNVQPAKPVPSNVPKVMAKRAAREDDMVEMKRERVPTFNQITDPYHHPFCLDIHVTKGSVRACFVHRVTSRVVTVAHSISKDMKFDLGLKKGKGMKACAAVGALLAKRAIEDDIHNAVYTPRKGDRIEGKIEVVLHAITANGIDVMVKLKQRKPIKGTPVRSMTSPADGSAVGQHNS